MLTYLSSHLISFSVLSNFSSRIFDISIIQLCLTTFFIVFAISTIITVFSMIDEYIQKKILLNKCKEDYMFEFYKTYKEQQSLVEHLYYEDVSHGSQTKHIDYKF